MLKKYIKETGDEINDDYKLVTYLYFNCYSSTWTISILNFNAPLFIIPLE